MSTSKQSLPILSLPAYINCSRCNIVLPVDLVILALDQYYSSLTAAPSILQKIFPSNLWLPDIPGPWYCLNCHVVPDLSIIIDRYESAYAEKLKCVLMPRTSADRHILENIGLTVTEICFASLAVWMSWQSTRENLLPVERHMPWWVFFWVAWRLFVLRFVNLKARPESSREMIQPQRRPDGEVEWLIERARKEAFEAAMADSRRMKMTHDWDVELANEWAEREEIRKEGFEEGKRLGIATGTKLGQPIEHYIGEWEGRQKGFAEGAQEGFDRGLQVGKDFYEQELRLVLERARYESAMDGLAKAAAKASGFGTAQAEAVSGGNEQPCK